MIKSHNGMQIDKVNWLTAAYEPATIGMIQITNEMGEKKVYVGAVVTGMDEDADIKRILEWGSKLHPQTAEHLHNHLKVMKGK